MKKTKLWSKEVNQDALSEKIEKFTVGRDRKFDLLLAPFDIIGTSAHVKMLESIGYLTSIELNQIVKELEVMLEKANAGELTIDPGVEDIHSQIELHLTQAIGEAGKKIHTGRSRNDQVALAIKLYLRSELKSIAKLSKELFHTLLELSEQHKKVLIPGYTHYQIGMPSSIGLWLSAFAESLSEDLEMLSTAFSVVSKNPLGSGAGYGSSFPLDRDFTTRELGLERMNINSIYAQMTRGKSEKITAMALSTIAATIGKLAGDICLFSNQNFGFVTFPSHLTTGSSIMPHKKNPDVIELIRGKASRIQSLPNELTLLTHNLMTGYNREYQLTKEILFPGIKELKECLEIFSYMLMHMKVKGGVLEDKKYEYLFSVEKINTLMQEGYSFREAYVRVGNSIEAGTFLWDKKELSHTHKGSIGNLCLEEIRKEFLQVYQNFNNETTGFH